MLVNEGRGRLFRRRDGKYLIYLPVYLAEDSMFPFKAWKKGERGAESNSILVKVSFKPGGDKKLLVEEWNARDE